jgi:glycosyltransferase involved in cell wall biosynthesis/SAM-dependent methyltransferase
VFFYWPRELAVEVVDPLRLASYRRQWLAWAVYTTLWAKKEWLKKHLFRLARLVRGTYYSVLDSLVRLAARGKEEAILSPRLPSPKTMFKAARREISQLSAQVSPIPFPRETALPLPGWGVYLRLDYWAPLTSGGSYGHTCFVAKELAATTQHFLALMANHYPLLEELGVDQLVLLPPGPEANEHDLLAATGHYRLQLRALLDFLRPAYVYERLVLGNYAAAQICRELGIPYVVEYNGSEISMKRSFEGKGYRGEEALLAAEKLAFDQATAISVVSRHIKADLVERGVNPAKILVNPNGVDPEVYAPLPPEEKRNLRAALGYDDTHRVIGFIGTFGGWHGIEILAAAIPRVVQRCPQARFLIIGDGNLGSSFDTSVSRAGMEWAVIRTGRVPQQEGARLLKACDLYVSPHSSHMVDRPFFGSPTKVFEYMALGGGIAASDLEQIGEVLSPALRVADLRAEAVEIGDRRAVLCRPGDVDELVEALIWLVEHPREAQALGANARRAAVEHFSWQAHVERLWRFLLGREGASFVPLQDQGQPGPRTRVSPSAPAPEEASAREPSRAVYYDDRYFKYEAQRQWDNDPCGSHYVESHPTRTLEWFQEVERYRFEEYAPWMPRLMEFDSHSGERVLEIGGGLGTDLARFAAGGARVIDADLARTHLLLARENLRHRRLKGDFVQSDAEYLPFRDHSFDLVYSNGVLHHVPNTQQVIAEIHRVLKPGGKTICMFYAEWSKLYLHNFWLYGLKQRGLESRSFSDILSSCELSHTDSRPLVKVYSARRLRRMFSAFQEVKIFKRQLTPNESLPLFRGPRGVAFMERLMGWNLIVKARKAA